jgi:hypothetical protein
MHSILSLLSGAIMAVLVYGLSFCPSATLGQIDDVEETTSRADQDGTNPNAEDAQAPSGSLQGWAGRKSDAR